MKLAVDPAYLAKWNPFATGAVAAAKKIDKNIDAFNARQNEKAVNGQPTIVNRGSTYTRNGQPFSVNVAPHQHAIAVDTLDAWNKDPELKGVKPPTIGKSPKLLGQFSMALSPVSARRRLRLPNNCLCAPTCSNIGGLL